MSTVFLLTITNICTDNLKVGNIFVLGNVTHIFKELLRVSLLDFREQICITRWCNVTFCNSWVSVSLWSPGMRAAGNFTHCLTRILVFQLRTACPVSPDEAFAQIESMSVFLSSGFQGKKKKKKINVLHILKGNPVRNVSFKGWCVQHSPVGQP